MNLKIRNLLMLLSVVLLASLLVGCTNEKNQKEKEKPVVVATISQIGEPLTVIAGDYIEVTTLMGTGVDPHLYQVTPSDIKVLENSEAIIYNGLHLEANMLEVFEQMAKKKPVLAIAEKIDGGKLLMDEKGAVDPHLWFDLALWGEALSEAVDVLIELAPDHKKELETNRDTYLKKLTELHEQNLEAMNSIKTQFRVLVTAHDAFQYFGRAYNIEVVGLQGLSTESEVSLSTVQAIVTMLVEREVPAVFVESSVNPAAIQAVIDGAATKGHKVNLGGELFSDAMGPENDVTGTYIGMYNHNITTIVKALNVGE